jgi:hypothetical protein
MNKALMLITLIILISVCKNEIIIRSPKILRDLFNGTIETSLSNFGKIPYGYIITGKLHFDPDDDDRERACKPINMPSIPGDSEVDESPIIMIDR